MRASGSVTHLERELIREQAADQVCEVTAEPAEQEWQCKAFDRCCEDVYRGAASGPLVLGSGDNLAHLACEDSGTRTVSMVDDQLRELGEQPAHYRRSAYQTIEKAVMSKAAFLSHAFDESRERLLLDAPRRSETRCLSASRGACIHSEEDEGDAAAAAAAASARLVPVRGAGTMSRSHRASGDRGRGTRSRAGHARGDRDKQAKRPG